MRKRAWKLLTGVLMLSCALVLILIPGTNAIADESEGLLADIRKYVFYVSESAKSIDDKLTMALIYLNEWLITPDANDKNDKTAELQANFSNYTNTALNTTSINNELQKDLTQDFLGSNVTTVSAPYANDLTYQTLLGFPFFNPDPRNQSQNPKIDAARNYIKNTAGLNIQHILPQDNWKGSDAAKQKYQNFYNTVASIQTFNIHVLGEIYSDYKNGGAASAQQASLIQQASNSGWFSTIASEHIGLVLRQILMYNSQLLVVATQMLQTQKEMLAAQAMTNSLLVLGNQFNENNLLGQATGQIAQ